ncbi:MAG: hypothetical protein ACXWLF_01550 [Myxococcaceae bacterium]
MILLHLLVLACPACARNAASPGVAVLLPALLGTPFLVAGAVLLGIRRVSAGAGS